MSLWSSVEGSISIHASKHFSVEKALREYLSEDEIFIKVKQSNIQKRDACVRDYEIAVNWCMDGMRVAVAINNFITAVKNADTNAQIDLCINIRWVA